ncbi:serine/threonine-protein kinase [Streptomyces sp. NPDC026672]|uniref:serine/threonine-protein kinase n=1 Tax=unclassified Streptomyces TaxID=2593676 RepID=UPI00340CA9FC
MLIAGRYELRDPIGRGAMGEVWRAYDGMAGRPVAVKLLLPQSNDTTATSRFRLEAQTAGRLNHPHVVGVLDFGAYDDRLFLVMELVDGESLAHLLGGSGPLSAERVARIATEAASGLAAAHRQGIVHRDIKPANLLLDAEGSLKIGDFGIARFVDDPGAALTATGQIVGTSLYLAPERALGQPAGPASDLYALGCVLYQLLTGRTPFEADTPIGVLHQHLDAVPVPPRELGAVLPPAFENYLLGLLAKRPEERPSADQVAEWFGSGAWRGRPEPLPVAAPVRAAVPPTRASGTLPGGALPGPAGGAFPGPGTGTGESRSTTYVLPSGTGRRGRRAGVSEVVSRRARVAGAVAGVALFVAAVLVGMAWFSPDSGTADTPSPTTTSDGGAPGSPEVVPGNAVEASPGAQGAQGGRGDGGGGGGDSGPDDHGGGQGRGHGKQGGDDDG